MNLHNNKELFEQMVLFTSGKLSIEPAIIEKDYYVTLMLKAIAEKQPNMIFKGGTSLSKCYKLIQRFSEDIDLSIETDKATEGMRKRLKVNIVSAIDEQGFILSNPETIRSRRDFNRYEVAYPTLFASPSLKQALYIETAVHIRAFPTTELPAASYIYECLHREKHDEIIGEYGLEPFNLRVLSVERSFIDKVFAIADYYLSSKIEEHSRHIYDLYKLAPMITLNEEFKNLVCEVREARKHHATCLSARDGMSVVQQLKMIVEEEVYKSDYEKITRMLLYERVEYTTAISAVKWIIESGMFD